MAHNVVNLFRSMLNRITNFSIPRLSDYDNHSDWDVHSIEWLKTRLELQIRRCLQPSELFYTAKQAFNQLFPDVEYCELYLRFDALRDSEGSEFPPDILNNLLSSSWRLKQGTSVTKTDSVFTFLKDKVDEELLVARGVSCLPVVHSSRSSQLVSLILFVSKEIPLDSEAEERFELLTSSISQSFVTMQAKYHSSTVSLIADLSAIDDNISEGQMAVVRHLKKEVNADSGFMLAYNPSDDDFVLKAFDHGVVPEKRFPSQSLPSFYAQLNQSKAVLMAVSDSMRKDILTVGGNATARQSLIAPVNQNTQLVGFVVLLNQTQSFKEEHLRIVSANLCLSGTLLYKDMVVERERTLRENNEKLHQVAKNIFTHLDDLTILLKEIMQEARSLCHAERCSVFLLDDKELVAKVFDGDIATEEVRISSTDGVAGHVVQTGKTLNIKDAYSHPLFYRGVDESTGFRTRCILCFPIKDEKGVIIGAAQLCNKTTGPHFDSTDEVLASALSTYCCISLVNSLMYKDVLDAHNRVKLANELMVFHMHVPPQDVTDLMCQPLAPLTSFGDHLHLQDFHNSLPRAVSCNDMPLAVISMMHELDFVKNFKIKSNTLARFILMVKKGYRDPPYHNWTHAFSVAHFAYLLVKNLKCISQNILEELEALGFFVAALCHDIDHRGTSNSFQVASNSVLAALYSSEGSVMERHHFSQTMCILNTQGCNIFENVSRIEYQQLLDLIREVILSTDIAHHLRIRGGLEAMADVGYDKTSPEHKTLLLCLFMTSADLADQTKPWSAAKGVSKMLYKEFFSQGDLEKALGRSPMEMMDRERASIPDLQIGFIDYIVSPAFHTLELMFPSTDCLVKNIRANREHWMTIKTKTADRRDSLTSLDVFDFIEEEDERHSSVDED
ncbi:cGMP-dependent 3',5'-cyclic phosphodiesterase-like [Watersipora subatra]|uniref:cGMP-dependent 3',5'-cyclic phosphodiesterase-like n=1 Tax=Watersipora subatra TaxID=2589382 RepID=UPI00355C3575